VISAEITKHRPQDPLYQGPAAKRRSQPINAYISKEICMGIAKYLLVALLVYVVFKLFSNENKRKRQETEKEKQAEKQTADGELAKDPVCGTYVSVTDSISVKDNDKIYHFCSYDCRDAFLKLASAKEPGPGETKGVEAGGVDSIKDEKAGE
jgi:YHS domain-containing protein